MGRFSKWSVVLASIVGSMCACSGQTPKPNSAEQLPQSTSPKLASAAVSNLPTLNFSPPEDSGNRTLSAAARAVYTLNPIQTVRQALNPIQRPRSYETADEAYRGYATVLSACAGDQGQPYKLNLQCQNQLSTLENFLNYATQTQDFNRADPVEKAGFLMDVYNAATLHAMITKTDPRSKRLSLPVLSIDAGDAPRIDMVRLSDYVADSLGSDQRRLRHFALITPTADTPRLARRAYSHSSDLYAQLELQEENYVPQKVCIRPANGNGHKIMVPPFFVIPNANKKEFSQSRGADGFLNYLERFGNQAVQDTIRTLGKAVPIQAKSNPCS